MKILKEEGCGVDCSSLSELMMSDCCGFSGSDIMFSSNVTPKADFLKARELGAYINLDDFTHIDYLDDLCGIPETICCRFNPGGHFEIETQIMDNPGEAKYGFTREQLFEGFKVLQQKGAISDFTLSLLQTLFQTLIIQSLQEYFLSLLLSFMKRRVQTSSS